MPSSRTVTLGHHSPTDLTAVLAVFAGVPDPRARRGVRHSLAQLLTLGVQAVIAGACSFAAIGEFAAARATGRPGGHGSSRAPDESTFRRVFARVDADALAAVIGRGCGPAPPSARDDG